VFIMRTLNQAIEFPSFSAEDMQMLLAHHEAPCVSIYMASQPKGADVRAVVFALGQLLDQAETQLVERGARLPDAQALLRPTRQLLAGLRTPFWQHQAEGLALFLAPDVELHYRLPLHFTPQMVIGKHFYIRPLLPLLSGDGRFFVLALSEKCVRLFQGTRSTMQEIPLQQAPRSLAESLRYDEFETQIQQHSTASSGLSGGRRAAMFHGHGSAGDAAATKAYLMRFLHEVDTEVVSLLDEETAPLVLAGVKSIQGGYREISRYQHVAEQGIAGNPDKLEMRNLHQRGWPIVAPRFQKARTVAIEKFRRLYGQADPLAISGLEGVLASAHAQQVESLFVAGETQRWGTFDPATSHVQLHDESQPDEEELVDLAVRYTLLNGGMAYTLDEEEMPAALPVAALLRY
jgi:hypothetical protein